MGGGSDPSSPSVSSEPSPLDGGRVLLDDKPASACRKTRPSRPRRRHRLRARRPPGTRSCMPERKSWKKTSPIPPHRPPSSLSGLNEGKTEESRIAEQGKNKKRGAIRPKPNPELPVGALSGGNQQKVCWPKWLTQKAAGCFILNETHPRAMGRPAAQGTSSSRSSRSFRRGGTGVRDPCSSRRKPEDHSRHRPIAAPRHAQGSRHDGPSSPARSLTKRVTHEERLSARSTSYPTREEPAE